MWWSITRLTGIGLPWASTTRACMRTRNPSSRGARTSLVEWSVKRTWYGRTTSGPCRTLTTLSAAPAGAAPRARKPAAAATKRHARCPWGLMTPTVGSGRRRGKGTWVPESGTQVLRRSGLEGSGLEVERAPLVARQQRKRLGLEDRHLVIVAGECLDGVEGVESRERHEGDLVAVAAPEDVRSQEARDRAHRREQAAEQEALVRVGVLGAGVAAPHASDHVSSFQLPRDESRGPCRSNRLEHPRREDQA